jgi:hypothetical protein
MITKKTTPTKPMQKFKKNHMIRVVPDWFILENVQNVSSLAGSVLPRKTQYKKSMLIEASKCPKEIMTIPNKALIDSVIVTNK